MKACVYLWVDHGQMKIIREMVFRNYLSSFKATEGSQIKFPVHIFFFYMANIMLVIYGSVIKTDFFLFVNGGKEK